MIEPPSVFTLFILTKEWDRIMVDVLTGALGREMKRKAMKTSKADPLVAMQRKRKSAQKDIKSCASLTKCLAVYAKKEQTSGRDFGKYVAGMHTL